MQKIQLIILTSQMRTSREGVYEVGDVTGSDPFVCIAAFGAKISARNAMNGNSHTYDDAVIPAVVFIDPQVASVGLAEARAISKGMALENPT